MGRIFPVERAPGRLHPAIRRGTAIAPSGRAPGHVLVELAVAVVIVGILAAVGFGTMGGTLTNYRLVKAARLMQSDIQHMRAYAVATNRQARLCLQVADTDLDPADVQVGEWVLQVGNRSSNSNEWDTLPIDLDGVPRNEQGERSLSRGGNDELPDISLAQWDTIEGPGTGNEDCLVFSPRGWLENPAGDFASGYVDLEFVNKRALRQSGAERVTVRVSRGGLARIEGGDSSRLPGNAVGTADASAP